MTDLRTHLRDIETAEPPDLWTEIRSRAIAGDDRVVQIPDRFVPGTRGFGRRLVAATLAVLVFAAAAALVWQGFLRGTDVPAAPPDLEWTTVADPDGVFDGAVMFGVAASAGRLIAVGQVDMPGGGSMAAVWTSTDGSSWSRVRDPVIDSAPGGHLGHVVAAGPGFVAAGETIVVSADGLTWSPVEVDLPERVGALAAAGPGLVAVEGVGFVSATWTSADGFTWTRTPVDRAVFPPGSFVRGLVAGGPGVVATGGAGSDLPDTTGAIWTSPDGSVWTRIPLDDAVFDGFYGGHGAGIEAVAAGPRLVAVGTTSVDDRSGEDAHPGIVTSADGVTWEVVDHDPTVFGPPRADGGSVVRAVGRVGERYVVVGTAAGVPAAWISTDGATWERVAGDGGAPRTMPVSLTAWGDGFVAVGALDYRVPGPNHAAVWVAQPV